MMSADSNAYHVRIPDLEYYQEQIKCQAACPVRTDARGYVTAIAGGRLEEAYQIARTPNPLASICGRVCNAPCETACRRGDIDAPISIRPLKRVVTERYGAEAQPNPDAGDGGTFELGNVTVRSRAALRKLVATPSRKNGRVAVIGCGPAGLGCAHDLALLGHAVTIFDAAPASGGMLRLGIPLYRLQRELLDREVGSILDLGVELRLDTEVGRDHSFADLRRDFDAIFIATGLGEGRSLRIPGADLDGVLKAIDFLLNVNMGYQVDLGQKVIIIGGGNVAVDAARMALRQQQSADHPLAETDRRALEEIAADPRTPGQDESLHAAIDAARTALRLGVTEVHMVALESWQELPASELEIEEALEEGIQIHPGYGPHRILGSDGQVIGLETLDVASIFDESGRFNPTFAPSSERTWECDTVILAIGQAANLDFLGQNHNIEINSRGLVVADPDTGSTSARGVYAGGDVVYGPRILIEAVRDGQQAAIAIDAQIQGQQVVVEKEATWTVRREHRMPEKYMDRPRSQVTTLPVERRIGIAEVEVGYDQAEAMAQAERCLNCGINTIFDATKCILCGGCVDVCPWDCLKIVHLTDLAGDDTLVAAIPATYGIDQADLADDNVPGAAMLKDDTLCTRCGLCARRCPTGAITMETFSFKETPNYAGNET
jgi:NADPH-dependent glutamate synthase beta subunit-like oxidoreductase